MVIRYYKDEALAYTNRKRYGSNSFSSFVYTQETQASVLLGDGATTSIKTSVDNICNYVTIDDTRWYVTSYTYLNGAQVVLNLQRDVIGENGITDMFGKVHRGFTNTKLKNRKELSLNQILKKRIPLRDNSVQHGNISLPINTDTLWGIMYFSKKSDGSNIIIDIPGVTINASDYTFIENGTIYRKIKQAGEPPSLTFTVDYCKQHDTSSGTRFSALYSASCTIYFNLNSSNQWEYSIEVIQKSTASTTHIIVASKTAVISEGFAACSNFCNNVASYILSNENNSGFVLPTPLQNEVTTSINYDGITIKKDNVYYSYKLSNPETVKENGTTDRTKILNVFRTFATTINTSYDSFVVNNTLTYLLNRFYYTILSPNNAGQLTIPMQTNLVDEPYSILVCPLYSGTYQTGTTSKTVNKEKCFNIFNQIIQSTSGDNGLLVDAQIYPYCPNIAEQVAIINDVPIFSIFGNTYDRLVTVTPNPIVDVKKDYIERVYSIISPEQSGKFDFHFYDYINNASKNETITFIIRTALKPFSLLSCCIPVPEPNSLIGETYNSDLRGCSPSGNGFECSLSSNAFETYRRQNSNYQQIFALQKGELEMSHETERVNEKTSAVVNTLTQTAMGALGGHALGGNIGAIAGGAAAGVTVGAANAIQYAQNEKLREYEVYLQQQNFDLQIGTVKNLPNSINRVSSFNEIVLRDFYYVLEVYECTDIEKSIVDTFIGIYGYELGVIDFFSNYYKEGWYIKGTLMKSDLPVNQNQIAATELNGGVYYYE